MCLSCVRALLSSLLLVIFCYILAYLLLSTYRWLVGLAFEVSGEGFVIELGALTLAFGSTPIPSRYTNSPPIQVVIKARPMPANESTSAEVSGIISGGCRRESQLSRNKPTTIK